MAKVICSGQRHVKKALNPSRERKEEQAEAREEQAAGEGEAGEGGAGECGAGTG